MLHGHKIYVEYDYLKYYGYTDNNNNAYIGTFVIGYVSAALCLSYAAIILFRVLD